MLHIPSNFLAGGPISQVPASWFRAVAEFINNLVAGYGLKLNKTANGPCVIEVDPNVISPVSRMIGEPEDKTDDMDDETYGENGGSVWTWRAGGSNGLKIDCYCEIGYNADESKHTLERATLTFSKDGLLVAVDKTNEQKVVYA